MWGKLEVEVIFIQRIGARGGSRTCGYGLIDDGWRSRKDKMSMIWQCHLEVNLPDREDLEVRWSEWLG